MYSGAPERDFVPVGRRGGAAGGDPQSACAAGDAAACEQLLQDTEMYGERYQRTVSVKPMRTGG